MKKIMTILMLSCKKASALIIKKEDFKLKSMEKAQLFFHTMMCDACRRFEKQNKMIKKSLEQHFKEEEDVGSKEEAPEQIKERILAKLEVK